MSYTSLTEQKRVYENVMQIKLLFSISADTHSFSMSFSRMLLCVWQQDTLSRKVEFLLLLCAVKWTERQVH